MNRNKARIGTLLIASALAVVGVLAITATPTIVAELDADTAAPAVAGAIRGSAPDAPRRSTVGTPLELRRYRIDLKAATRTTLDLGRLPNGNAVPAQTLACHEQVLGPCDVSDYGAYRGARLLGFTFAGATSCAGDRPEVRLPADEILVEVAADGRFARIAHPASLDAELRYRLVLVLELFQIGRPDEPAQAWDIEEPCYLGRVAARYETAADGALHRRVLRILELCTAGNGEIALAAGEPGGSLELRLDEAGRLTAATGTSTVAVASPDGAVTVDRSQQTEVRLGAVTALDAARARDAWERFAKAATGPFAPAELARAACDARIAARDAEAIRGKTLDGLLLQIGGCEHPDAERDQDAFAARLLLPTLLAQDPEALRQAIALLDGEFGKVSRILLSALGEAGTPATQRVLCDILQQDSRPAEMRVAAVISFVQTERPEPASALALQGVLESGDCPQVAQSALSMLGGIAGRLADEPARQAALTALDKLAAQRGADPNWRRAYLVALGNSGHPDVLPRVEAHLASEDATVRQGAVRALRRLGGAQAHGRLLDSLAKDPSPLVREEALGVAAGRSDPATFAAVARVLAHDDSPVVRRAALDYMGARRDADRRARTFVEGALRDTDAQVRQRANELLSANRLGG